MLRTLFLLIIFAGSVALASDKSYFYCAGTDQKFQTVTVKQVVTSTGQSVSSTFKLDVVDATGNVTAYWQDGDVKLGSDDTFAGPFKSGNDVIEVSLKAPTYPYYKPRDSTITYGATTAHLNCNSINSQLAD